MTADPIGPSRTGSQNVEPDRAFASGPFPVSQAPIIRVSDVSYIADLPSGPLQILNNITFEVEPAEVVAIVGASGSGKTSLLMLLAGLERPSSGNVVVMGKNLELLDENELALFRRSSLGIVFQSFHLIPSLTALDNVAVALEIASPRLSRAEVRAIATAALVSVGLGDRLFHRPATLSGGQQQQVGLARAMVTKPRLLLADEPTGNLDYETGLFVVKLMFDLARQQNTAVVLITHDRSLAARTDRVFSMSQGELVESLKGPV